MARARTTKGLAKRIALDYFKQPHPFRSLRSNLSKAAMTIAAVVVVAAMIPVVVRLFSRRASAPPAVLSTMGTAAERILAPGPVSQAHAPFASQCFRCHGADKAGGFLARTSDRNCLLCHDGAIHHDAQLFTPSCAECHSEHRGKDLAAVSDMACTRCHSALVTKAGSPPPEFDPRITSFSRSRFSAGGHPEFRPLRPEARDLARIKLNHKAHLNLKEDWLKAHGFDRQLVCSDCHKPEAAERLQSPINYDEHCALCHPLAFDFAGRFPSYPPGSIVPHDTPLAVHLFLTRTFTEEVERNPGRIAEPDSPAPPLPEGEGRRLPEKPPPPPPPPTAQGWVARQVAMAETVLFRKDCALCHELIESEEASGAALPEIAPPDVPASWLPHARFTHRAHRLLACEACHGVARTSTLTADVLLPGIETCRECHEPGKARFDCAFCHLYHDRKRERPPEEPLTLPALAREDEAR